MGQTTVVTCLFDLASREAGNRPRVEGYLEWGEFVLGLEADLVCFADPELAPLIEAGRERHGLARRTQIVARALEDVEAHRVLPAVSEAARRNPLLNGDRDRDTPLYATLMRSKFELLAEASRTNPFAADRLVWVDFGIARRAKTDHHLEDRVFSDNPDAVRVLQTKPLDRKALRDRPDHLSYRRGRYSSALISGARERLQELCAAADEAAEETLADGYVALDEHLIELVLAQRPQLFSLHYGAYDHIVENYRMPRGSAGNLTLQLRESRLDEEWEEASDLAGRVVESVAAEVLVAEPHELAQLLEECFLVGYYADSGDRPVARRCAALYAELAHRNADFRDEFLRNEIRVRTNFDFVGQTI